MYRRSPVNCEAAITAALGQLAGLGGDLFNLYGAVAAAAPIVVTGYPHLFEIVPGDQTAALKKQINDAITLLNNTIQAVIDAQPAHINIVYVDVTKKFARHGIGSEEPFIHSPETDPLGAYHPNAAGYRAYAKAIFAAIRSAGLDDDKQAA